MSTKIILIDDHTLSRSGIKALLSCQSNFEVIGEVASGFTSIELVGQMRPDIVLLDLDMPVMSGRETLVQILSSNPQQIVVMLTVSEDNNGLIECMRIGARGFLLKNINADFLLDSIHKAVDGNNAPLPEMTTRLVRPLTSSASPCADYLLSTLTPREVEIPGYPTAGHSNEVIARHLELAESTIKVHVQNISRKLNLSSRVQAAIHTAQHKVPQPEGVQAADIRRRISIPSRHTPKSD